MKIGIMTWWHNTNYGGFLQGVATQRYLSSIGHDAELVEFVHHHVSFKKGWLLRQGRVNSIRDFIRSILNGFVAVFVDGWLVKRIRRLKKTQLLVRELARSSSRLFLSVSDIVEAHKYECLLIGSDQVWNPDYQDEAFSYLLRGVDSDVRKVSYAASVAKQSVFPHESVYRECLSRFDAISIREKQQVEQLSQLSGKDVEWVVDPTLLLSADEWRDTLKLANDEPLRRHICVYWLGPFREMYRRLVSLTRDYPGEIHLYSDIEGGRTSHPLYSIFSWMRQIMMRVSLFVAKGVKINFECDAREFIKDLSTAEMVLTDSFHAVMFSLVFNIPLRFVVSRGREEMSSRVLDFAGKIKLNNVIVPIENAFRIENISGGIMYDKEELQNWICFSKGWITRQLMV